MGMIKASIKSVSQPKVDIINDHINKNHRKPNPLGMSFMGPIINV